MFTSKLKKYFYWKEMNPQLHYYSDSDCDANQFSDIFGVKDVEKDELNHYSGEERYNIMLWLDSNPINLNIQIST